MTDWKLQAFVTAFGLGKPERAADVEAWITHGDEAAFARLSGRASKKLKDWYSLGIVGADDAEATMTDRGFQLARTVLAEADLIAWVAREGSLGWVLAYHRHWQATHGGPEVVSPAARWPHERRQAALAALLRAVSSDDALLAAAFGALTRSSGPSLAWGLLENLGASERSEGRQQRLVRRLGRIVAVQHRGKTTLTVFDDDAAADAFVQALPPPDAHIAREWLGSAEGMVAVFLDAKLDPKGTLDGKGGPLGWIDHDDWETASGTPAEVLPRFSFGPSFADAAIARATELGRTGPARIEVLYGRTIDGPPGQRKYGFYLGSFPYRKG